MPATAIQVPQPDAPPAKADPQSSQPKPEPKPEPKKAQDPPKPEPKPEPKKAQDPPKPEPNKAAEAKPEADVKPPPDGVQPNGTSSKDVVRELRSARARRLGLRLALFVLLPTLLAAAHFGLIASDQYESFTVFTIHSAERQQSLALVASLLGAVSSSPATHDTLATREYVLSRDMLRRLDADHHVIAHYKDQSVDFFSRLSSDATFEDAFKYYLDKVFADFDSATGALTLRVRAFDPSTAQKISEAILGYSEEMVNRLTERERTDQTRYANRELERVEKRLLHARKQLLVLQQKHSQLSPQHTAQASMSIRTALEGELAKAQAELMQVKSYMNPNAPQVIALKERARAISAQIAQQSHRLVDPKGKNGIAESLGEFEAVATEKEFAEKAYASALASVEVAQSDAVRQHRYLVRIAEPSKPDESTYPRRVLAVVTVFLLSLVGVGIGSLVVAAVREHARI